MAVSTRVSMWRTRNIKRQEAQQRDKCALAELKANVEDLKWQNKKLSSELN